MCDTEHRGISKKLKFVVECLKQQTTNSQTGTTSKSKRTNAQKDEIQESFEHHQWNMLCNVDIHIGIRDSSGRKI